MVTDHPNSEDQERKQQKSKRNETGWLSSTRRLRSKEEPKDPEQQSIPGPSLKDRIRKLTGELPADKMERAEAERQGQADRREKRSQPAADDPTSAKPEAAVSEEETGVAEPEQRVSDSEEPFRIKPEGAEREVLEADPLSDEDRRRVDDTTEGGRKPPRAEQADADKPSWQVVFQPVEQGDTTQAFGVTVEGSAVVGRADADTGSNPEFDLNPYGGGKQGVSRQHAVLMSNNEGMWLIDLDSTNGTWVNGLFLQPGMKYRLRNGDMIEFGTLKLLVRVIGAASSAPSSDSDDSDGSVTIVSRRKPGRS